MGLIRRKTGKICLLALAATLVAAPAGARRRSSGDGEFRLRVSPMLSVFDYTSTSDVTGGKTTFTGQHPGGRVDAEIWFNRRWGVGLGSEYWYVGMANQALSAYSVSTPLYLRVDGDGNAQSSETVLFAGPSLHRWPDARSYPGTSTIDTRYPTLAGALAGARFRVKMVHDYTAEFGGSYVFPYKLFGGYGPLIPATTHTLSGTALVDYRCYEGLSVGAGFYYEQGRLSYAANGYPTGFAQQISTNISAIFVSFRFWF
jgi:hypothetical protein